MNDLLLDHYIGNHSSLSGPTYLISYYNNKERHLQSQWSVVGRFGRRDWVVVVVVVGWIRCSDGHSCEKHQKENQRKMMRS